MRTKIFTSIAALALLSVGVASSAEVLLTPDEVQQITSKSNSFEGTLDGVMEGEVVRFKLLSATSFSYEFVKAGEKYEFNGKLARAGGSVDGNPTLNFKQPDQDDVRFEWLDSATIKFEFWGPGKKAGQTRNNPAEAKATLKIATDPMETVAVVTEERKEAREEATTLLPVGNYNWQPFNSTISMGADGSFSEKWGDGGASGFFIKSGDELCFDIVSGSCYTVSGADANGAYTLTVVAKIMQSYDQNPRVGYKTTLTPIK